MRKVIIALTLALSLAGCATPAGDLFKVITTTIENPLTTVDIYRVENTYAAALTLADQYRTYCYERPYAVLMTDPVGRPLCERRRRNVRLIQSARLKAGAAVVAARNFIAGNPTLNAASVVSAAWKAVTDFQSAIPGTR